MGRSLLSITPGVSVAKPGERRTSVKGDMFGLAALDLVLRGVGARVVRVAVDLEIACMDPNDHAADAPGLRIPAHVIADVEYVLHEHSARYFVLRIIETSQTGIFAYHAPEIRVETGQF